MRIVQIFFLILLFGCDNIDNRIQQEIDTGLLGANASMEKSYLEDKSLFIAAYQRVTCKDDSTEKKIQYFYFMLMQTLSYTDSLKTRVSRLDNKDINSDEMVKEIFLTKFAADSLYKKLNHSYILAQEIALKESSKIEIKKTANNSLDTTDGINKWKNQLFGLNTPLGVEMLLYGLEGELLKSGINCLDGYYPNKKDIE